MGEFTKRVREGDIAGPLRRTFTPENWMGAFDSQPAPDEDDHNTHAAGHAIHSKLEAIRSTLKISSSEKISATTKLRAFLAVANSGFFAARDKTKLAMEKFQTKHESESQANYTLEEMAGIKINLPGGFDWSPGEIVESLVDGIELPIRVVLQAKPRLAGNPRMNQIQWKEVYRELNLGIMYRFAEDIWDDCLWNKYKITEREEGKFFSPQDMDVIRAYHIGQARRTSLSSAFTIMAMQYQQGELDKGANLRVREVCGIERRGKRQVIKISPTGVSTEIIKELSVMRGLATEPYYGELLEERQKSLQGLSLSVLIDGWMVLSCASQALIASINERREHHTQADQAHTKIPEYAPTLQVAAITEALVTAIGVNQPEAKRIVEFFTFRGDPGQEIWAQPIVPVGPDTVTPVFAAIVSPNLRRLVDVWMRQAGLDLGRRGKAFESHVRSVVIERIKKSKILSPVAKCIEEDYTFRPPGHRDEQIDLVFSIGNTVFTAEAKCILEPTESKSISMHRKTITGAAEQILRKAKAVGDHRSAFVADMRRFGIELSEDFKVVPLIVISTSTHVGVPAMDVPVIDEHILDRYLAGELEDIAYLPSAPSASKRFKTIFYSSAVEAEDRASEYFTSPPQMKRFVDGVSDRAVPIFAVDKSDWCGYMTTVTCIAGGIPLSLQKPSNLTLDSSSIATAADKAT